MRYTGFGNSREWSGPELKQNATRIIGFEEVFAEARRRKTALNIDQWQMEEYVTGDPIPAHVQQSCREIERAANAIARMSPIPTDFQDDVYWPRVW